MKTNVSIGLVILAMLLGACGTPVPTLAPTPPPPTKRPEIVAANGYRPVQAGDLIEGSRIDFQYLLPSQEEPIVDIALGQDLLQMISIKPTLANGLVAYIQELVKEPRTIYGFDENDPKQTEPKQLTLEANQPVEFVYIYVPAESVHSWSVVEKDSGELRAAYKLIRRKDGGLRVVDGYDLTALNSFNTTITLNGGGTGLAFSARLALLRAILNNPAYQRGENVMDTNPPDVSQYDPRILKIDPSQPGLFQNQDWVLVSRAGPGGGRPLPQ